MDVILPFLFCYRIPCYFQIDICPQGSEIFIKDLLASCRHVRIKNIKWLAEQLVSCNSQKICRRHLNLHVLCLRLNDWAQGFRLAMRNSEQCIFLIFILHLCNPSF
jgi:hypothetical protein